MRSWAGVWVARVCRYEEDAVTLSRRPADYRLLSLVAVMLILMSMVSAASRLASTSGVQPALPVLPNLVEAEAALTQLPRAFEENVGQAAEAVNFIMRGSAYTALLAKDGLTLRLPADDATLTMSLVGGSQQPVVSGIERLPGVVNFVARDETASHDGIPTWASVRYDGVYPGIDLLYSSHSGSLEYDFIVQPGGGAEAIRLAFTGAGQLKLADDGALILPMQSGDVRQAAPVIYQTVAGERRIVTGGFQLLDGGLVGFWMGDYDHSLPLVIDPVITASTYVGYNTNDDLVDVAVDPANGQIVAIGPTTPSEGIGLDVIIYRFNPTITAVVEEIVFPIGGSMVPKGVAVGPGSALWFTYDLAVSPNICFPNSNDLSINVWVRRYVGTGSGGGSGFFKCIGGSASDRASAISVDSSGNAYITGETASKNFPVTTGAAQPSIAGGIDAFVAKIRPDGSFVYSTYLGGKGDDSGQDVDMTSTGEAWVVGTTKSSNFPITANPIQATLQGTSDAFLTRLNGTGGLARSTYVGGSGEDSGSGIDVASGNAVFVTGTTASSNFPRKVLEKDFAGVRDAFVLHLTSAGAVALSGYLGGSAEDTGVAIFGDRIGNAYVTGTTLSSNFPTRAPTQPNRAGGKDVFIAVINAANNGIAFSTYLGGSADDIAEGIVADTTGNIVAVGIVTSNNFPTVNAIDATLNGGFDGYVTRISGFQLTTAVAGSGRVTSNSGGINCPLVCIAFFPNAVRVTLTARPTATSSFIRWEGACSGNAPTCRITIGGDTQVRAVFQSTTLGPNQGINANAIFDEARGTLALTGHILCRPGGVAAIQVTVTQQSTGGEATGQTEARCARAAAPWAMQITRIPAGTFEPGPALACATATIRAGSRVIDARSWCKEIVIEE